jgi:hypothetical protein
MGQEPGNAMVSRSRKSKEVDSSPEPRGTEHTEWETLGVPKPGDE